MTPAPAEIERLSPDDVTELLCAVTGTSMQVAVVLTLDVGVGVGVDVGVDAVRRALAQRIVRVPRLRQRIADPSFGCGRPVWVDDPRRVRAHFAQ